MELTEARSFVRREIERLTKELELLDKERKGMSFEEQHDEVWGRLHYAREALEWSLNPYTDGLGGQLSVVENEIQRLTSILQGCESQTDAVWVKAYWSRVALYWALDPFDCRRQPSMYPPDGIDGAYIGGKIQKDLSAPG